MNSKILMAALLSGVVLAAGAAQAEDHRERPDFATLDLNGDGFLSLEELQTQGEARFADVDTNGDGGLSADELIAAAGNRASERAARMIERHDDNSDGLLQIGEMPRRGGDRAEQMFDRVDADGDGVISLEEFETAKNHRGGGRDHGKRDCG